MPVNSEKLPEIPAYNPPESEADLILNLNKRIQLLKDYRKKLRANPYDDNTKSRSIEQLWDYCDFVALPHKYYHPELKEWMASNSRPLIYSKIDTALAIMFAKNPEVEMSARQKKFEKKTKLMEALYNISWDKGDGKQQLYKFMYSTATYGFAVGREYHRFEQRTLPEMVMYDPETGNHQVEEKPYVCHDEPYFEALEIRDCWFDPRSKPYDKSSMRDWYWEVTYDYSTYKQIYMRKGADGKEVYPNAKYAQPTTGTPATDSPRNKADIADDDQDGPQIRLGFYESTEANEFIITDGKVIIYKGVLMNGKLSCVISMWRFRNAFTIYGIGIPEVLENDQELLDTVSNMTVNQVILSILSPGFYGGNGEIKPGDMQLEPKLKKLRDAEKIQWVRVPPPPQEAFAMMEDIRDEADTVSGITQSLEGEQVGKTLGEAVLNREAGLRRLATPLDNIQFALEDQATLRVENIQRIYSRPVQSQMIRNGLGEIVDPKLFQQYLEEKMQNPDQIGFVQQYPEDTQTPAVFKNTFRTERLPFEKDGEGEYQPTEKDDWLEIMPNEITGEYDIRIKAMSTIPVSKALEEARAGETFGMIAELPGTDIFKAEKWLLKKRGDDPDDVMQSDQEIMATQQQAQQGRQMGMEGGQPVPTEQPMPDQSIPEQTMPTDGMTQPFANAFGQ